MRCCSATGTALCKVPSVILLYFPANLLHMPQGKGLHLASVAWWRMHPIMTECAVHHFRCIVANAPTNTTTQILFVTLMHVTGAGLNCPIKQLDLSFNNVADEGACALAGVLSTVPLVAMELEGNQVRAMAGGKRQQMRSDKPGSLMPAWKDQVWLKFSVWG